MMLHRPFVMRAGLLALASALTMASLIALIVMSSGVDCGFPDPTPYVTLHLLFAMGFVWLAFALTELIVPRIVAMPLAMALYFAVGPVGLALARASSDWGDVRDVSAWVPFWLQGVFLGTRVLPGSC